MARQRGCGGKPRGIRVGTSTLGLMSLWLLAALAVAPVGSGAQTMADRCGQGVLNAPPEAPGRWIAWNDDGIVGRRPVQEYAPILQRLSEFVGPFRTAKVLDPPPGVEVRPHRVVWGEGPPELGPPLPRSALLIQIFHPTVEEAGEASASIEVIPNTLFPLLYGTGSPITEDATGPIFMAPEEVGSLAGAPVFWSGRKQDCLVVFKGHDRPLWTPVSRGRFLEALVQGMRDEMAEADSLLGEALEQQEAGADQERSAADREMQEAIRQLQQIDPKAAAELERQFAEMKREMVRQKPAMEDAGRQAESALGGGFLDQVAKFEAELAEMSPGQRASPAYVGGLDASDVSLLSSEGSEGSRPLVAPNVAYLDAEAPPGRVQLLIVELRSTANHAPEKNIIAELRQDVDWAAFWDWVREH